MPRVRVRVMVIVRARVRIMVMVKVRFKVRVVRVRGWMDVFCLHLDCWGYDSEKPSTASVVPSAPIVAAPLHHVALPSLS